MEQKALHCFIDGVGLVHNGKSRTNDADSAASYHISINSQPIPYLNELQSASHCIVKNMDSESFIPNIMNKYHSEIRSAIDFSNSYILGDMIGGGGDGTVHTAIDPINHSPLPMVIKRINTEYNIYDKLSQSLQELHCLTQTKVATLHNIYYDDKNCFIYKVYDRLDANLSQIIYKLNSNKLTLTESQTRRLLFSLCNKIKRLHENAYIHGDIKPDNILFGANNGNEWHLIDFDRIKYCRNGHQIYSKFIGTFGFTAPELVFHGGGMMNIIDHGVDIWAVGLMIIWCLNGGDLGDIEVDNTMRDRYNYAAKHGEIDVMTAIFNEYYESVFNYNENNSTPRYVKEIQRLYQENKISMNLYDLLKKILVFEPQNRLNIGEVLMHEWFEMEGDDDMVLIDGKERNLYEALIDVDTEHIAINIQRNMLNTLDNMVYNELLDGSTSYDPVQNEDITLDIGNNMLYNMPYLEWNSESEYMVDDEDILDLLNGSTSYDPDKEQYQRYFCDYNYDESSDDHKKEELVVSKAEF